MGNAVLLDPDTGVMVQNESDLPVFDVMGAVRRQHPMVAALVRWSNDTRSVGNRVGGIFDRDRYTTPQSIYDQMRVAYDALENDDVVGGVADTTESLALNKVSFYCEDEDQEDVWNQWAADVDLDRRLREMWRELFAVSQIYVALWWGEVSYTVRGKTDEGIKRKKKFPDLQMPTAITLLDPLKIVPIGTTLFNREQLAWIADRLEAEKIDDVLAGRRSDPVIEKLMLARYTPTDDERKWLAELRIDQQNLFLLNPGSVFRHTLTRPQYQRFAAVRMKSVFELLDLKHQLRQMDRAHLVGGTNFIVLIKKGTDQQPAKPEEIANLQANVTTVARVPVIVGDHRLNVEIVTPKQDATLDQKRYSTLDARITARLFQMFMTGNPSAGTMYDDSAKLSKLVARGMESRRHMLRRSLESSIFKLVMQKNASQLDERPDLRFHPQQIALDFDSNFASFILDLRASNDISRETVLSLFDLDQGDEALLVERERDKYDDIFLTQVPFSTPNPVNQPPGSNPPGGPADSPAQKRAGRRGGGNSNGGGAAPGSGQGQAPRRPRRKSD